MLRNFVRLLPAFAIAFCLVALLTTSAAAYPQGPEDIFDLLPTPGYEYDSTGPISFPGTGITFDSVHMDSAANSPGGSLSVAPPGGVATSFFDIFTEIDLSGGSSWTTTVTDGVLGMDGIALPPPPGDTSYESVQTEMTQLDLSGGTMPPGYMLRESPTLPSTGTSTIDSLPDGNFRFNSFFDIFTELSVDGGQTWIPASGPLHMQNLPEPGSIVLAGCGAIGLLIAGWRRRRAL